MSTLDKELEFLVIQFLDEKGYRETAHMLERESGTYFDMKYFEYMVLGGKWNEAERYLSGFTSVDDNRHSTKIYFELRKQKFLEALDNDERAKALDILMKDLKVFAPANKELYKEMSQLLAFDDIREHKLLTKYGDAESTRKMLIQEIKEVIEANPILHGKLRFPSIKRQRLRCLINQSLNWQHMLCTNPHPNPNIKTMFVDHVCEPLLSHSFSQSTDGISIARPTPNSSTIGNLSLSTVTDTEFCNVTKPARDMDVHGNSENMPSERPVKTPHQMPLIVACPGKSYGMTADMSSDLPKTVVQSFSVGSTPISMDFHPVWQTTLLVGTRVGDIGLWNVISGKKLALRNFEVWDIGACSSAFKAAIVKDPSVSVNSVMWCPDGLFFGVAFSKHIVQLYLYSGGNDMKQQLEIDAHDGSVNDVAFSTPRQQLWVITCGDDKKIKVWDVLTGSKHYTFEGHTAPVYSVHPHKKENIHLIFSTSVDGKIKAWLYDNMGSRVDCDVPGLGSTKLASTDSQRLFSCGNGKDGKSYLVEWDESEGGIKRTYKGLKKHPSSVAHFDTTKNRYLAVGDDHMVKFWDMDNVEILTTTDANGSLLENPCINFNKCGMLLAVSANENKIKILARDYDLQISENSSVDVLESLSKTMQKLSVNPTVPGPSAGVADEGFSINEIRKVLEEVDSNLYIKSKFHTVLEINKPSQCQFLQLPALVGSEKVTRLTYTNAGNAILALESNGIHRLWKWPQDKSNFSSQASTEVSPHLWQPRSGLQMRNDLEGTSTNHEESLSCFVLSKNDSYLMSSSGGVISVFNMLSFKALMTILPPPPSATCLAFLPRDNNIVAIGVDDSTILIYNIRTKKIKTKLEGHSRRVTGLNFSNTLNVLVSADAESRILVWDVERWTKEKELCLQIHGIGMPETIYNTQVQFHPDQILFLAVLETHLSILEAEQLRCIKQWVPGDSAVISHATFSSDGRMVYASFVDGFVAIFDASNLEPLCRINPTAYLPNGSSWNVYPHVITAHPLKPTQFAIGLTNGSVFVIEPLEPKDKWCK